jgi:hypothetical protein
MRHGKPWEDGDPPSCSHLAALGAMTVDEQTTALAHQLLNLVRHDNISGVVELAQRIQTEAPALEIGLEEESGSLFLRYADNRVQIRRQGPKQRVRYVGEFGSEIETKKGRPLRVRIEKETILRLAAYIEGLSEGGRDRI